MAKLLKIQSVGFGVLIGLYGAGAAYANPTGAQVVHGSAAFATPNANTLQITNTPNAIINWQDFSINQGEVTEFIQQNAQSAVLNRVVGNNLSEIHGSLLSNGRVFLINQAGIVFGEDALIDTAGLVASSLNISNEDFLNGHFHFEGDNAGAVINRGVIAAGPKGEVVLIAPQVENSGAIRVKNGSLILAAGESITLSSWELEGIEFEVQAPDNEVINLGELVAEKGAVGLFAGSIKNAGTVSANSISTDAAGNIVLSAQQNIELTDTSNISADSALSDAGNVTVISDAGDVYAAGSLSAFSESGEGGTVKVLGEQVALLADAKVNVSGAQGGGDALIGGDYQGANDQVKNAKNTYVAQSASINADSLENGDGGRVIVWADKTTRSHGDISARGGEQSGDGGFVETSGKEHLVATKAADISAKNGAGGTWLLDPSNIEVVDSNSSNTDIGSGPNNVDNGTGNLANVFEYVPTNNTSQISAATIIQGLENAGIGGKVILDTSATTGPNDQVGDINVNASIALVNNAQISAQPATLVLKAHNNINIAAESVITSQNFKLNIELIADQDDNGTGDIVFGGVAGEGGAQMRSNGGNILLSANKVDLQNKTIISSDGVDSTGNVTVEANELDIATLTGSVIDVSSGDMGGDIIVYTRDVNRKIALASEANITDGNTMNLLANELDALKTKTTSGQGQLIIGRNTQEGNISVRALMGSTNKADLVIRTKGTVDFKQTSTAGIDFGGKKVTIDAGRIDGSENSSLADIVAQSVDLKAVSGIQNTGGGGLNLQLQADTVTFNNTGSGRVGLTLLGSATAVNSSVNSNGEIEILQSGANNTLTVNDITANGTGDLKVISNGGSPGANIVIDSIGLSHMGTGDIQVIARSDNTSITANGAISHSGQGNIELLADQSGGTIAVNGSGISHLGSAGEVRMHSNGQMTISAPVDSSNKNITLRAGTLILNNPSSLSAGTAELAISGSGATIIDASGGVISASALTDVTAGTLVFGRPTDEHSVTINDAISGLNKNLRLETGEFGGVSINASVDAGGKDIHVKAGNVTLGSASSLASAGGELSFEAVNAGMSVSGFSGDFALDANEIGKLQDGFSKIKFITQGAGKAINIGNGPLLSFQDSVDFSSGDAVNVTSALAFQEGVSINAGTTINLGANVDASSGNIDFLKDVVVQDAITVSSASGGNINISGTVNGNAAGRKLTLNAGTGQVNINANVGQTTALDELTVSGSGGININTALIKTDNNQVYTNAVDLLANTVLESVNSNIQLNGLISGAFDLAVNASNVAGLVNVNGVNNLTVSGSTVNLGDITTTGNQQYTGNVSFAGLLSTGGNITVMGNANINGDRTFSTSGGNFSISGTLNGVNSTDKLTINAGAGGVNFNGDIGQTTAFDALSVSAQNISLKNVGSTPSTSGVTNQLSLNASNMITFDGDHVVAGQQNYTAGNVYSINGNHKFTTQSAGGLSFTNGNIQANNASSKLEFITASGDIAFNSARIGTDSTTEDAEIIINSSGGDITLDEMGQFGPTTKQIGDVSVNAGAGTITMVKDINLGDNADAAVRIRGANLVMQPTAEIATDKDTHDGDVYLLVDDLQMTSAGIYSGNDVVIDTMTAGRGITFGNDAGQLSISNTEMDTINANGKIRIGLDTAAVSTLGIGSERTADITFAEQMNMSGRSLTLNTSGNIANAGTGLDLVVGNLALNRANVLGQLEINAAKLEGTVGANLNISEVDDIVLGDITQTVAGNITVEAGGDINLQKITAANSTATLTAGGSINDIGTIPNAPNLDSLNSVTLSAVNGIGAGNAIEVANMGSGNLAATVTGTSGSNELRIDNVSGSGVLNLGAISNASSGNTEVRNLSSGQAVDLKGAVSANSGRVSIQSNNANITNSAGTIAAREVVLSANGGGNIALSNNVSASTNLSLSGESITQSAGAITVSGLLFANAQTGISLAQTANNIVKLSATNALSGDINVTSASGLEVAGSGVFNNASSAGNVSLNTVSGNLVISKNVESQNGDVTLNSNNNDIQVVGSAGASTQIRGNAPSSRVVLNAGNGNVLIQGGSNANESVEIRGGPATGGLVQVVAKDLTLQGGTGDNAFVSLSAFTTDVDLTGNLLATAGDAVNAKVAMSAESLLDIDATGPGNIIMQGAGSGSSNGSVIFKSENQIDINTDGNLELRGGAGDGALVAIGDDNSAVTINIGQGGSAIGGDVVLSSGSGTDSEVVVGVISPSATLPDANVLISANKNIDASGAVGAKIGVFEQGGSARASNANITMTAGLGTEGGSITLGNSTVQAGTNGRVSLSARDAGTALQSEGRVTQSASGSILADQLYVRTFNNDTGNQNQINLIGSANDVNKLAMRLRNADDTASIDANAIYVDANDIAIDGSGILTTGETAIDTAGSSALVRITSGGQITQGATAQDAIVSGFLDLSSSGGTTLNNTDNDITLFSATNVGSGDIELFEKDGFTVGASALIDGISNVAGRVQLVSTGSINQTTGSDDEIIASELYVKTLNNTGSLIRLANTNNDVDRVTFRALNTTGASEAAGAITYVDADDVQIQDVSGGPGNAAIQTASAFDLTAGGTVTQGSGTNDEIVAGNTTIVTDASGGAAINLNNADNLISGRLIARSLDGGAKAGGAIDVTNNRATDLAEIETTNTFTLNSAGAVDQTNAPISVDGLLTVTANGGVTLNKGSNSNALNRVDITNSGTGNVTVVTNQAFEASVTNNASSGNVTLTALAGDISLNKIEAATGTANITASAGQIIDNNADAKNIIAGAANLTASNGIGSSVPDLGLEVDAANLQINNQISGNVDIRIQRAGNTNISAITHAGAGNVKIDSEQVGGSVALSGPVSVNSGNLEVSTQQNSSNIIVNAAAPVTVNGNIDLLAATSDVVVGAVVEAQGTGQININAATGSVALQASAGEAKLQAANNIIINANSVSLNAGAAAGQHAVIESTANDVSITADTINLNSASAAQDALIKAGNVVNLQRTSCTNCARIAETANADAGIIATALIDRINGFSNWSGAAANGNWNDAANWFEGAAPTGGNINLDADSRTGTVNVNSVVTLGVNDNFINQTKDLAIVSSGNLTIENFSTSKNVQIDGGTLTLNGSSASMQNLTVASGLLNGTVTSVGVNSNLDWSGGTIAADTNVSGSASITGSAVKTLSGNLQAFQYNVNSTGDLDIISNGQLTIDGSSPGLDLVQGNIVSSDATGSIANDGSLSKSGAGASTISAKLDNSATSSINVGDDNELVIGNTGLSVDDASYNVGVNATLTFNGTRNLSNVISQSTGSTINIASTGNITSTTASYENLIVNGTLNTSTDFTANDLQIGGTVNAAGADITVNNATTMSNGAVINGSDAFQTSILNASGTVEINRAVIATNTNLNSAIVNGTGTTLNTDSLTVTGSNTVNRDLSVTSATTIGSGNALTASGANQFGDLTVVGDLTAANTLNTNNLVVDGTISAANIATVNTTTLNNGSSINITDASTFNVSNLIIAGSTTVNRDITATNTTVNNGTLNGSAGSSLTTNSLNVTGSSAIERNLTVTAAMTIGSTDSLTTTGTNQFSDLAVDGLLSVSASSDVSVTGILTNTGTVNVQGDLSVANGYNQTAGITQLNGGTLAANVNLQGGSLVGNGAITGDLLLNNAILAPGNSAGLITVNGNLDFASGSQFQVELGGTAPNDNDRVTVTGNVTIDSGAGMNVSLINGFSPADGSRFEPLTYSSVTGDFGSKSLPAGFSDALESSTLAVSYLVDMPANNTDSDTSNDSLGVDLENDVANLQEHEEEVAQDSLGAGEPSSDEDSEDEDEDDVAAVVESDSEATYYGTLVCR